MGRLTLETPAPVLEAKQLLLLSFALSKPRLAQAMTVQIAQCDSFAARLDGRLVAALFFLELDRHDDAGRRVVEVAFVADPAVGPHMREGLALTRLIFSRVLETGSIALQAMVRVGNPAGHRLARMLGFTAVAEKDGHVRYRKVDAHEQRVRRRCEEGGQAPGPEAGRGQPPGAGALPAGCAGP